MNTTLTDTIPVGVVPVLGTSGSASGAGPNAAPVASGCVRWCMNVALQSFAGEPWAVNIRPLHDATLIDGAAAPAGGGAAAPGTLRHHSSPSTSLTSFHGKTTTQATALENHRASAANTAGSNTAAAAAEAGSSSLGGGAGHHDSHNSGSASLPAHASPPSPSGVDALHSGTALPGQRRRSWDSQDSHGGMTAGATTAVTFGEGFGSSPNESCVQGLGHVTAAERCGIQLCVVDYDDGHDGGGDGSEGGSPTTHQFPMPNEEVDALRECVQAVNDPPVTYGSDELLTRIANVEFIPSETPTPEGLLQYCLHSSLEPILHATLQPAVTAVVDHCVSAMVLVYGATQEMKQMGLIGTPEECGLLPHGIRMFMDRYTERKEQQSLPGSSPGGAGTGATSANQTHIQPGDGGVFSTTCGGPSTGTTGSGSTGGGCGSVSSNSGPSSTFVFPSIGSSAHRFTRVEASFIAFDAVNVVDLLDLGNKHIELVLRLAPPPTPSEFEDTGIDTGTGRPHRPTTDSFVVNARVTSAETTNDALSALDVGLENLARALEMALFQSESGSSLLFSLTAYTDTCRCATFHILCLAEDPAAQTWLASTILARSQAIPLGEEQSWASIQNTPMPPPLHHHAATILVPALCFGNMFTSVLICVYNSMTALGRLNRDLTLAVTGYRMRTIPRVTSATTRRSTKKLPTGWEEHFTEDGRRYFTDTNTNLSSWYDPRLKPDYHQSSLRGGSGGSAAATSASTPGSSGSNSNSGHAGRDGSGSRAGRTLGASGSGEANCEAGSGGGGVGMGGESGAANGRIEGSNAYVANATPQQSRRSRVGLGQGDRDFLTRALQQPAEAASGGTGGDAGTVGGEDGIPAVDVGIVVIDTKCRPRVVLNSNNPDFMSQFEKEQRELSMATTKRQKPATKATGVAAQASVQPQQVGPVSSTHAPAAHDGVPGGDASGTLAATAQKDAPGSSTEDTPRSTTPPASQLHNGHTPSLNTSPDATASSSATVDPPTLGSLTRTRTHDDISTTLAPNSTVETSVVSGEPFTSLAASASLNEPVRPPLDPRRLALNPDLDDDDDDDGDMLALSRSDATSIEDFVFDDDSDEDFASADYTPAEDTVMNTRRFYQNAMQEQVAMPLEEAHGTSVVGTPINSSSPSNGGGTSNPGSPGAGGASPASVAISPDMQDLESLVEEFSKFFAQAYQAEQEVQRLQDEVRRLRRHLRRLKRTQAESMPVMTQPPQAQHSPHRPRHSQRSAGQPTAAPSVASSSGRHELEEADQAGSVSDKELPHSAARHRQPRREGGNGRTSSTCSGSVPSGSWPPQSSPVARTTPRPDSPSMMGAATTAVPAGQLTESHLLYSLALLSDVRNLTLSHTTEPMRARLEPIMTALTSHIAASSSATPLGTDGDGTLTESSSISRNTHSPVSRVTSPAVASVRSFQSAAATAVESGGAAGDRALLMSLLDTVLREWQLSETRNGSIQHS